MERSATQLLALCFTGLRLEVKQVAEALGKVGVHARVAQVVIVAACGVLAELVSPCPCG